MAGNDDGTDGSDRGTKVDRVARKYGLEGIEAELVRRRTGEGGDRESLRSLEEYFNRRVLRAALESADEAPIDGEVENVYRLLTDDGVTEGMRIDARRRLERRGVDVDDVESDFVSYQTINRFFDATETEAETATPERTVEDRMERLFRLESRLSAVATSTLEGLRTRTDFSLGEFDVFVGVTVTCTDCGARRNLRELLRHRGCDC